MKILMTSCGGIVSGIESWPEYGLATHLVKMGHDVTVMSSSSAMKAHKTEREETINGINVERFNPVMPANFFKIAKNKCDIIHMHHLGYLAPISSYAALTKNISKKPFVFTVHGLYHDPYIAENSDDPFAGKISYNIQTGFPFTRPWRAINWFVHLPLKADRITALTNWEKKEISKFGTSPSKIDVIPNGIHLPKYKKKTNKKHVRQKFGLDGKILLFVGQPTRRKGWEYFVRAMPYILKEIPDAKAVFIGYRSDGTIENLIHELGLEDKTKFLGFQKEEDKIDVYKSADVFVFPTLYEGFGIIFLEAMAAGIPVVTTDVAGNKEIIENGKNGLLVRPRNEKEVARATIKLLGSSSLRRKIMKNNLKKVVGFDWPRVANIYLKTYEDVL